LIPEAIAGSFFSIIAGVDPDKSASTPRSPSPSSSRHRRRQGRPGMISAATAATAVLMVTLVKEHGLQYLLAATVLAGLIQIAAGIARLGYVMRFVSRSVMTGFVNALAILIFMAQLPELIGVPWLTYVMVAAGLAIIYLFPLITKAVPSPLVTIVVLTAITWFFGFDLRTVGDMGALPDTLPVFLIPDIPLNLETLLDHPALFGRGRRGGPARVADDRKPSSTISPTPRRPQPWNASARASPTPPPASSAAWPAAR
jgi:SulP family sulfate permease